MSSFHAHLLALSLQKYICTTDVWSISSFQVRVCTFLRLVRADIGQTMDPAVMTQLLQTTKYDHSLLVPILASSARMAFKISWGITHSFLFNQFVPFFLSCCLFPTPVSTLAQDCKTKVTPLSSVSFISMPVPRKICYPSVVALLFLLLLLSWWLWWFSVLFQWFLHLKRMMIQMIWPAWVSKCTHTQMTVCFIAPYWRSWI